MRLVVSSSFILLIIPTVVVVVAVAAATTTIASDETNNNDESHDLNIIMGPMRNERLYHRTRSHFLREFRHRKMELVEHELSDHRRLQRQRKMRRYLYFVNDTVASIYQKTHHEDVTENFQSMWRMINGISHALFEVLFGRFLDIDRRDDVLAKHLNRTRIIELVTYFENKYTPTLCPDIERIKEIFWKLFLTSIKATIEIQYDIELEPNDYDELGQQFDKQMLEHILKSYKEQAQHGYDNECDTEGIDKETVSYPNPIDFSPVISEMVQPLEKCEKQKVNLQPDLSNGYKLVGVSSFMFNLRYTDDENAGKDFYVTVSLGEENIPLSDYYIAYYTPWCYMGFQALGKGNTDDEIKLRIIYSSANENASIVDHRHCYISTDNIGVSCAIDYVSIKPDFLYYIRSVYNEKLNTFTGYFIDSYEERTIKIGAFKYDQDVAIEWQVNTIEGYIEMFNEYETMQSCCHLSSLNVMVLCPVGEGMLCDNNNTVAELGTSCRTKLYSNLDVTLVEETLEGPDDDKAMIEINGTNYDALGFYIHRGWVSE